MASLSSVQRREGPPSTPDAARWRGYDAPPPPAPSPLAGALTRPAARAGAATFGPAPREIARMIESEIIPRLMLAHRPARGAAGPATVEAFVEVALRGDAATIVAHIDTLLEDGSTLEEVYGGLLIPAARRLGVDWEEDVVSFTDVTLGLNRLQQAVRMLGGRTAAGGAARSIFLVPAPLDQHTFGLVMLDDCFRRGGWRTRLDPAATVPAAAASVRADWFDAVAVSATCDASIGRVRELVAALRAASFNLGLFVMAGGRAFADRPELALEAGADATAATAADALLIANEQVRANAFG